MLTEAQKNVLLTTIDGLIENALETAGEDGADLSEEVARVSAVETLVLLLNEEGFNGAVDGGYIIPEDEDCEPVDFSGASIEEMIAFINAEVTPAP